MSCSCPRRIQKIAEKTASFKKDKQRDAFRIPAVWWREKNVNDLLPTAAIPAIFWQCTIWLQNKCRSYKIGLGVFRMLIGGMRRTALRNCACLVKTVTFFSWYSWNVYLVQEHPHRSQHRAQGFLATEAAAKHEVWRRLRRTGGM